MVLDDGTAVEARRGLSNATPEVTFTRLMTEDQVPADFRRAVAGVDYTSAGCKINLAVDKLPNFVANPNSGDGSTVMPHHKTTIHLNCENTDMIVDAYMVGEQEIFTVQGGPKKCPTFSESSGISLKIQDDISIKWSIFFGPPCSLQCNRFTLGRGGGELLEKTYDRDDNTLQP